ncbi:SMC-Scp complex subunit ScpB [bacterium]|nr:SMC-Scp complex subunit ScpB [bacterium]
MDREENVGGAQVDEGTEAPRADDAATDAALAPEPDATPPPAEEETPADEAAAPAAEAVEPEGASPADEAEAPASPPDDGELLCALQCLLFVAGEPLPVDRLAQALGQEVTDIPGLCDRLNEHLEGQGLHVVQLAGGYALATRPEFADYVQRLLEPEPERLSIQALETLAIIAYRQPITRPEIDALRGVNSGGVVTSLLEKGLLRIRGRKDAPGRPFLLETTAHFLSSFGLGDLSDLPRVDLPEIGETTQQPRVLGEALEELAATQEEAPSVPEQ